MAVLWHAGRLAGGLDGGLDGGETSVFHRR